MKRAIGLVLLLGLALGQGFPRFFQQYLEQSPDWTRVQVELSLAERRYRALAEDAWAAPLEREEAAEALARAKIERRRLRLELWQAALSHYLAPLLAEARVRAAEAGLTVAEIRAEAARIRYRRGAILALDLKKAEKEVEEARLRAASARADRESARAFLAAYGAAPPETFPELSPPRRLAVKSHVRYRLAELTLAAARRAYDLAQGPDTAELERKRRQEELEAARKALAETQRDLEKALAEAERDYREAEAAVALQTLAQKTADEQLSAARARYQKGLISRLELEAARARREEARLALLEARLRRAKALAGLYSYAEEEP